MPFGGKLQNFGRCQVDAAGSLIFSLHTASGTELYRLPLSPKAPVEVIKQVEAVEAVPAAVKGTEGTTVVVAGPSGMEARKTNAPMTLIEQVELLKRELGLSGTVAEVVHQAATQLAVNSNGKPLTETASACLQALGL